MTKGWLLTDPKRCYIPAAKTDVAETFKKHGWVPPSKAKEPIVDTKTKGTDK